MLITRLDSRTPASGSVPGARGAADAP